MTVTYFETRTCHICDRGLPLVREFWVQSGKGEWLSGCRKCRNTSKLKSYHKTKHPHVLPPVMNCARCNEEFKPGHTACKNTRYCSPACRAKDRVRDVEKLREQARVNRSRPEVREHQRLQSARWRKDNQEHIKANRLGWHVKWKYGITQEDYENMLSSQGGHCAICKTDDTTPHTRFSVDHCHTTGKVRGLLCHFCNVALGAFKDEQARLINAILYLDASEI